MAEMSLLLVIALLAAVIGMQSYFLYSLSQTVSVLKASSDTETARALLKVVKPKQREKEAKEPSVLEVSPGELSEEGIANLRKLQDNNGS